VALRGERSLPAPHYALLSSELRRSGKRQPAGRVSLDQFFSACGERLSRLRPGITSDGREGPGHADGLFHRPVVGRPSGIDGIGNQHRRARRPAGRVRSPERFSFVPEKQGSNRLAPVRMACGIGGCHCGWCVLEGERRCSPGRHRSLRIGLRETVAENAGGHAGYSCAGRRNAVAARLSPLVHLAGRIRVPRQSYRGRRFLRSTRTPRSRWPTGGSRTGSAGSRWPPL